MTQTVNSPENRSLSVESFNAAIADAGTAYKASIQAAIQGLIPEGSVLFSRSLLPENSLLLAAQIHFGGTQSIGINGFLCTLVDGDTLKIVSVDYWCKMQNLRDGELKVVSEPWKELESDLFAVLIKMQDLQPTFALMM